MYVWVNSSCNWLRWSKFAWPAVHLFYMSTYPNSHASPIMVNRIENLRSTVNIGRLKLNGIWTLNQLTVKSMIPSFMSIQIFWIFLQYNQGSTHFREGELIRDQVLIAFTCSFDIHRYLNVMNVQQEMLWHKNFYWLTAGQPYIVHVCIQYCVQMRFAAFIINSLLRGHWGFSY